MERNAATSRFFECPGVNCPGGLEQVIDTVQEEGFKAINIRVWPDKSTVDNLSFISRYYDQDASDKMSIAYELRNLGFFAVDQHSAIMLNFEIGWTATDACSAKRSWIHADAGNSYVFSRKKDDPERHSQRFLSLSSKLYQKFQPSFGWIERLTFNSYDKVGYTSWDDVDRLKLPHVYWANFFGPAYVNKLGKEFLMQAPGWKCEEMDDGGCLYVLTPSLAGTGPVAVVREVQKYFGVEHVRRRPSKGRKRSKK